MNAGSSARPFGSCWPSWLGGAMPSGRPGGEKPDEASPCAALLAGRSDACGYPPIGTNPERSRSPMRIVRAQISEQTARRRCDKKRLGVAKKSVSRRIIKRSAGSATGTGPAAIEWPNPTRQRRIAQGRDRRYQQRNRTESFGRQRAGASDSPLTTLPIGGRTRLPRPLS